MEEVLRWSKMATTMRWELGKTRFTWKGSGNWDVADGFIIIETIDAGLLSGPVCSAR
jgi:hypothetical protein